MKKITLIIAALAAILATFAQKSQMSADQKLRYAEAIIENYYVDNVDADTLVNEAIIAMLKTLDPHSAYSSPEETRELNQPLEGKFSGIGVQFSIVRDTVCVVQTTAGGPSEKVGIRPGDRIIYVNDTIFTKAKMQNSDVLKTLRGPKGSIVNLKIKRAGTPGLIDFRIIRDDIPIYSVDAAYMADATTGYIRISRFAEDTPNEVQSAIDRLRKKGMRNLIIDLESNGGGYLGAAHGVASLFLNKGDMVVYTQGLKQKPAYLRVDKTHDTGIDRIVIMVDQYSASAAEILSGAIQDNDRGLIVGRRTFGKGLVQRPFPFPDGSMIRLTTSRYYTPSGRCIQKNYAKGHSEEYQLDLLNRYNSGELWSADSIHFDENQKYHTLRNKRTVYGGGGIMPDLFVPVDTTLYTTYYRDLNAKGVINQFVVNYIDNHRAQLLAKYKNEDQFAAKFDAAPLISQLVEAGKKEGVEPDPAKLAISRPLIEGIIKGLLERDLYPDGQYMRHVNHLDPIFNNALQLINNPRQYNELLSGKKINA